MTARPVTADDVVASFRHHMGPDSKSAAKSLLEPITDIKADGPETVIFTLKDGNADFPYLVSDYHIPIMPTKDGKSDWQSGVRTGPFMLEKFEPGVSAKFKRNPNYFKSDKPYFDEVEFIAITDVAARTNALTTGDVDYIGRADLKTLDLLKRNPNVEILELSGYGHYVLPMNTTDGAVRQYRCAHRHQICDRPRGDRRRRSSSAMRPSATTTRSRQVVKYRDRSGAQAQI